MRKLWILIGMLTCLLLGGGRVLAAETDYTGIYVWDTAAIMTEAEQNELQARAAEIAEKHRCACYIVTVGDYRDYSGDSPYEAAKSIWNDMDFGYGDGKDGEMLMLSMDDRDFAIIAHGDYGNAVFTDYGKEKLDEVYLDNFRDNDWYGGFSDYLTQLPFNIIYLGHYPVIKIILFAEFFFIITLLVGIKKIKVGSKITRHIAETVMSLAGFHFFIGR